jgi:hypothetical protein
MSDDPVYVEDVYEHALDLIDLFPEAASVGIGWAEDQDGDPVACATGCIITFPDSDRPITAAMIADAGEPDLVVKAGIRAVTLARIEIEDFLSDGSDS